MSSGGVPDPALRQAPAILGIDGGNSKTDVVVIDGAGAMLAWSRGGPTCHQFVGMRAAMSTLEETVEQAYASAGWPDRRTRPVTPVGVFCLAGLDLPIDERRLGESIEARRWSQRTILYNDTMAVFRAGGTASWGVGVVCGAGINCAARSPDGRTVRFPALGELSGDFASGGTWLGARALGLALRAADGRGPHTRLEELVPLHLGLPTAEAALEAIYTGALAAERLPGLAPLVFATATCGDAAARDAINLLADELVAMATAAIRRLDLADLAVEVVFGGGVFRTKDASFHERIRDQIRSLAPRALFSILSAPPVVGAALLGADTLGLSAEAQRAIRDAIGGEPARAS